MGDSQGPPHLPHRRRRLADRRHLPGGGAVTDGRSRYVPTKPFERQVIEDLPPRELEVARLIVVGMANAEIADRMKISVKTVDTHRLHLLKRLGEKNNVTLALRAIREGLILASGEPRPIAL